jgi:lipase maturation factor 1
VLSLFAGNPFPDAPPTRVRTVRWQYWFTDRATRRATGLWWRRQLLGPYVGTVLRGPDGRVLIESAP